MKRAKKKLKFALKECLKPYYESGFTNTANKLLVNLNKTVDRIYSEDKKK